MAKPTAKKAQTPVEATKHLGVTRTNIPTAELESLAESQHKAPQTLLYPRDTSLDPQLVWKGKDERDRAGLEIPVVPIYIQENIAPRALIEDLRRRSDDAVGPSLFGDFNGLEFQQRVEFYQHEQRWTNRMILGDSLLVMASLAEKERLKGKVQMIYIDPPYGIKFGSNWQVSTRNRIVKDGRAEDTTPQPEQVRAFRDTWELGISSYLTYTRDRLVAAYMLLSHSGSVFVQIGEENVHLVRGVLDEVFGPTNFVSDIAYLKTSGSGSPSGGTDVLASVLDHVLWYAKDRESIKYRQLYREKRGGAGTAYNRIESSDGGRRLATTAEMHEAIAGGGLRLFRYDNLTSQSGVDKTRYPVTVAGRTFLPTPSVWKTSAEGMVRLLAARRVEPVGNTLAYIRYYDDFRASPISNAWMDTVTAGFTSDKTYIVQTNPKVIERCILMTTDPGDLVLDPTCGSGTTAHVAEHWGRRWITIDTSRVALALARTRLMSTKYPYYVLADSPEGIVKAAERSGRLPPDPAPPTSNDVSRGFVYERIPHVTLKSIANNSDIREGLTRAEVDTAITRHADTEVIYDRPYEDKGVVRVSGPFTVESLSPHRQLTTASENPDPEPIPAADAGLFVDRMVDNLRKAGVQNTVKNERLTFQRLDSWPGAYIHADGDYLEGGKSKRAAVCIGPEYGTVGAELIREAAKEASKFADLLVVCGFAFEANVGEEAGKLGRLTILKAKMNPDLSMGDELLKKTGAGNLFMVFGEPDIEIRAAGDDEFVAEIRGLDIYDPTTGAVRPHDIADIACWFIDTNYNEEAFFVRHAYFVGAGDPYEKLKRALKADIDPEVWATLYRTESRPFKKPTTGKIAIKVINHYGDEILKAYQIVKTDGRDQASDTA
jgi:adenine-specific DNA-methyltransferase